MGKTERLEQLSTHIRFQGTLRDNLFFTLRPGWETDYIAHRPHQADKAENPEEEERYPEEKYRVELLTEKGFPILSRIPEIKNTSSCEKSAEASKVYEVTAYLPVHKEARSIIFRRGTFVFFERKFSPEPPEVQIKSLKIRKNKGTITWEATHKTDSPLRYNVGVILEKKRIFLLAKWREETSFSLDLTNIPGADQANLVVLASDGLRSAFDISKSFEIPEKEPQLLISDPGNGAVIAPGQPISYNGRALDVAGKSLPQEQLVWRLNKEIILRGEYNGVLTSLQPGSHILRLEWVEGEKTILSREVRFEVASPSKIQNRYQELISTYLEGS